MGMKIRKFCAEELRRQGKSDDEIEAAHEKIMEKANKVDDRRFIEMKKSFETAPAWKIGREQLSNADNMTGKKSRVNKFATAAEMAQ
jgi:hypothetical protein